MTSRSHALLAGALLLYSTFGGAAWAQGQGRQAPAQAAPAAPAPPLAAAPEAPRPPEPAGPRWEDFPVMTLERIFRGPLRDTVVQRWRDPVDGATCMIYVPLTAAFSGQGQYLIYGPNSIGSISCFGPLPSAAPAPIAPSPPAAPAQRQR